MLHQKFALRKENTTKTFLMKTSITFETLGEALNQSSI